MYRYLYEESLRRAVHRVWILSDIQQSDPRLTRRCLDVSLADMVSLGNPFDRIWYLGDSVEGTDMEHLLAMTDLQERRFGELGVPLCYVTGNHDYDWSNRNPGPPQMPFWEMVRRHPGWETTAGCEDFCFRSSLGDDYAVWFLSDHIARDGSWLVTHGHFRRGEERYPYTQADADALRARIAAEPKPVITASHYAFLGGNRESRLMSRLLPLPENVRIHFCGHAHIGDWRCAKKDAFRRISWVDWHDIPQINVSSMENVRGRFCRSVLLHIHRDGQMAVFFRNHDAGVFTEAYLPARENAPANTAAFDPAHPLDLHIVTDN